MEKAALFPGCGVTAPMTEALRRQSNSHTSLFLLDRNLYRVLGWVGSDHRCFLLVWSEMLGMPLLHVEGLGGIAPMWLMAIHFSMAGLQLCNRGLVPEAGKAPTIPSGFLRLVALARPYQISSCSPPPPTTHTLRLHRTIFSTQG